LGKITGFLEYQREDRDYEPVAERVLAPIRKHLAAG